MVKIQPTGVGYHPPMWEEWLATTIPFAVALLLMLILLRRRMPARAVTSPARSPALGHVDLRLVARRFFTIAPYLPLSLGALAALLTGVGYSEQPPGWFPETLTFALFPGIIISELNDSWVDHNYVTPTKIAVAAVTNALAYWFATRALVGTITRSR